VLRPEFRKLYITSPLVRGFMANTFAVPATYRNADATMRFVFGPQVPPADFAVEGGALLALRPSHFYAMSSDVVAIPLDLEHLQKRYGELRMPVGIIFGTADQVLDHREHGLPMIEQVAGVELQLLEGVGHMPQFAETERVVAFIERIAIRAFAVEEPAPVG
jgi:pimeloyl-ACP methyl ester carboxylesterase